MVLHEDGMARGGFMKTERKIPSGAGINRVIRSGKGEREKLAQQGVARSWIADQIAKQGIHSHRSRNSGTRRLSQLKAAHPFSEQRMVARVARGCCYSRGLD